MSGLEEFEEFIGGYIGGSDGMRYFKVISVDGKKIKDDNEGRYKTKSSPGSAAKKAFSQLTKKYNSSKIVFVIKETTQGSKKKEYGPYEGIRVQLTTPIKVMYKGSKKPVLIKHEDKIRLIKEIKQKGGTKPPAEFLEWCKENYLSPQEHTLSIRLGSSNYEYTEFKFSDLKIGLSFKYQDKQRILNGGFLTPNYEYLDGYFKIDKIKYELEYRSRPFESASNFIIKLIDKTKYIKFICKRPDQFGPSKWSIEHNVNGFVSSSKFEEFIIDKNTSNVKVFEGNEDEDEDEENNNSSPTPKLSHQDLQNIYEGNPTARAASGSMEGQYHFDPYHA